LKSKIKTKVLFIVNPISGAKSNEDLSLLLEQNLEHSKFDYQYIETQYRDHATEIAHKAVIDNFNIVVACGGDGTINEVAKALVHTDTTLGIIPMGSGNGFAMHIGMGRNTRKAIQLLNQAEILCIDTCTINERFFINLAGIGFDALIAYRVDKGRSRGLKMYAKTVSKELFKFKAETFTIRTADNKIIKGAYSIIAVANAAMYGFNFNIAPKAKLTDGLLDIVLIKKSSIARMLLGSWRMLNKTLDKSSLVEIIKSKEVTISTDKPYYYHIDGESFRFNTDLHFKLIPRSLKVLFPKNSPILKEEAD